MKRRIVIVIVILMMVAGLCVLLYPTVSNFLNERAEQAAIADYRQEVVGMAPAKLEQLLAEARTYNEKLLTLQIPLISAPKDMPEYWDILNVGRGKIMGYITIEKSGIRLTIRHGMEESTLQNAVGHLEGSSFPVGGAGTHTVLMGHRGMPGAKLFTDIDQLKIDDTFVITVLTESFYYKIDNIVTVLPEEVFDYFDIVPDEEHITLMTCTPYGVNTHRLLLRGTRFTPEPDEVIPDITEPIIPENRVDIYIIICVIFIVTIITLTRKIRKRKSAKRYMPKHLKK